MNSPVLRQTYECTHADTSRSFCEIRFRFIQPGGAGDVEEDPGRFPHEVAQEHRGGGPSRGASTDVLWVRGSAPILFPVLAAPPHLLHFFSSPTLRSPA